MEDFLSFLTGNIKTKGMTVNEFCRLIGISRQKFYRFVKEPRRFSDENIVKIQDALRLTDPEIETLRSYLHPGLTESAPDQPTDYSKYINTLLKRRYHRESLLTRFEIEYIDASGAAVMHSPQTIAAVISGEAGAADRGDEAKKPSSAAESVRHDFTITIYNCLSSIESSSAEDLPSKSIMIIAGIVKTLDDHFAPAGNASIRVRHYLSESRRKMMTDHDSTNEEAMAFNFKLLIDTLPLLSVVLDYSVDSVGMTRQIWTQHSNLCLIEHRSVSGSAVSSSPESVPQFLPDNNTAAEYFALSFSDSGDCSACRLGNEEASHIFRFLSTDTRAKSSKQAENFIPNNPNLTFYEFGRTLRQVLIHPDLCFDDVPKEMWFALYSVVESTDDKAFFESVFRGLLDPFGQYAFLDFKSLVYLAVSTLEQRAAVNGKNGKIVVCHPDGLRNLIRTGIITDLQSEDVDYTGKSLGSAPLRFPAPMIKNLLCLIRDSIVRRQNSPVRDPRQYDWVNYYILQPNYPYPEVSYIVYRDFGVFPLYSKSRHRHTNTNAFQNSAIGTAIYDHIINDMIGRRGQELDSDILSDEHSIALIDKLISQLEDNNP